MEKKLYGMGTLVFLALLIALSAVTFTSGGMLRGVLFASTVLSGIGFTFSVAGLLQDTAA